MLTVHAYGQCARSTALRPPAHAAWRVKQEIWVCADTWQQEAKGASWAARPWGGRRPDTIYAAPAAIGPAPPAPASLTSARPPARPPGTPIGRPRRCGAARRTGSGDGPQRHAAAPAAPARVRSGPPLLLHPQPQEQQPPLRPCVVTQPPNEGASQQRHAPITRAIGGVCNWFATCLQLVCREQVANRLQTVWNWFGTGLKLV
jgi:hypothetical protein